MSWEYHGEPLTWEEWAEEHDMAAGFHYGALIYLEDNPQNREDIIERYGDEAWHEHWFWIHLNTAEFMRQCGKGSKTQ